MANVVERIRETLESRPDAKAIEYAGRWIRWADVRRFGDDTLALLDKAGVPATGRIGVVIRNRAAHAAAVIGLLAHGRSLSFIYPFLPPDALAEEIESLAPAAVIAAAEDWPAMRGTAARLGSVGVSLTEAEDGPAPVEGLDRCRIAADAALEGEEGHIQVLSSGTTGAPKRITMPFRILDRAVGSAPGAEAGTVPPVQINPWPLGGVGGMCLLAASAATGTPMVLVERFTVEGLVDAVKRHKPPMLGLPPAAISMILDANVPPEDLASVESISGGSAALDPDIQERFEAKYGIPLYWAMGATEFCGTIIRWTKDMREAVGDTKRGSIGLPTPGVELRVVDPVSGALLKAGEEGLMEVHCPDVRPGWVRTTDLVTIDADGYVFHRGRHDGAIMRGGFKILPERIVEALRSHPSVADASVIGLPDARLGEVPVAAVELIEGAPPVDAPALIDHLRARIAPTYIPADLRIVDELPRTPSMKVSLPDVKRLFQTTEAGVVAG